MAAGRPWLAVLCERGCASESSFSFNEVVQYIVSNLYLFSFPSDNTANRCCGHVAKGQVHSNLVDLLLGPDGSSRLDFQCTGHSEVC